MPNGIDPKQTQNEKRRAETIQAIHAAARWRARSFWLQIVFSSVVGITAGAMLILRLLGKL
jgi:hypothetical protein